jgi:hypothetical protein
MLILGGASALALTLNSSRAVAQAATSPALAQVTITLWAIRRSRGHGLCPATWHRGAYTDAKPSSPTDKSTRPINTTLTPIEIWTCLVVVLSG